jgi:hypothetical protein
MSRRLALSAFLLAVAVAAGVLFANRAVSDEPPGGMTPEMEEMMKQWEKIKAPGPQHELLKSLQGTWVGTGSWTEMGMTSSFTEEATSKLVFGGRFVQTESTMTTEAPPPIGKMTMTSLMLTGFDNVKQKYTMAMAGDWSTSIGTAEGTYDAATKTLTMTGIEVMAPGKERKFRMVQKFTSADTWTFEMYFTGPDGKEAKAGEATYKRK